MKSAVQATILTCLIFGLVGVFGPSSAAEKPWDATPHLKCSDVITASGEFTSKTEAVLTWLVGYIDGISAPSILDKRLNALRDAGSLQVGPMVLAFCTKNQGDTLIAATTGVAEFIINAQPGKF